MPSTTAPIMPTDQDARLARETSEQLAQLVSHEENAPLSIYTKNNQKRELLLPFPAVRLLLDVLQEMGKGHGVTLTPVQRDLTTQQAADFLRVSRPYLIEELLEKGVIPYRKVGNRRRVRTEDLIRYQEAEQREMARRKQVMLELMAETERLGLYK